MPAAGGSRLSGRIERSNLFFELLAFLRGRFQFFLRHLKDLRAAAL
jgi:hypothetical protein